LAKSNATRVPFTEAAIAKATKETWVLEPKEIKDEGGRMKDEVKPHEAKNASPHPSSFRLHP